MAEDPSHMLPASNSSTAVPPGRGADGLDPRSSQPLRPGSPPQPPADDRDKQKNSDNGDDKPGTGDDDEKKGGQDKKAEQQGPPKPPVYKRPLFWVVLAAALIVISVATTVLVWYFANYEDTDDAFFDAHFVNVSPYIGGHVSKVLVDDNFFVHKGDVLIQLDPTDFNIAIQQSTAALDVAKAQVQTGEAAVVTAQANARQAHADVEGAQAEADRTADDYNRYGEIKQQDPRAVSQQQLDNAKAAAHNAAAQLDAAKAKANAMDAEVQSAQADVETDRQRVKSAEADLSAKQRDLSYATVYAPADGFITHRSIEAGQSVSTGQQICALVPHDTANLYITANFKETQITAMQPNQPVTIHVDAYPDLDLRGHVESIQRGSGPAFSLLPPENATGNYVKVVQRVPVKIVLDELPDPRRYPLGPGLSVEPRVKVGN